MRKLKKIMCLFLSVLMILSMCTPAFAIDKTKTNITSTNETQKTATTTETNSPLKIEISTNKEKYSVLEVAKITAKVTNISNEDIKNVSAEAVFNDLSPVSRNKSETKKEVEALKAGESISFTYKATLNASEHKLNFIQKILLWFVRFFNGGFTAKDNGFDNGRDVAEQTNTISFGKFNAVNTVKVWYGNNNSENNDPVTRGEWILKLADTLDWSEQINMTNNTNCKFDDITGHDCEKAVQYASTMNVFDETAGSFYPDKPATREFAAVTAVRALQFYNTYEITCNDKDDIEHLTEVYVAVEEKIFELENNLFYPNRELTSAESKKAIKIISDINNSTKIDEDHDNKIIYTDRAIQLPENIHYQQNDSIFTFEINNDIEKFNVGDIFLTADKTPYKIISITEKDGKYIIETDTPNMEEVFKSIDVEGTGTLDASKFIPAEGIEIVDEEEVSTSTHPMRKAKSSILEDIKIPVKIPLENDIALYANISIKNPTVDYKFDINWLKPTVIYTPLPVSLPFSINECMLKCDFNMEVEGGIKDCGKKLSHEGTVTVGVLPVVGIPYTDIGIYFEVQLTYTLEGKIKVTITTGGTMGVQVINNKLRSLTSINSCNFGFPELEAQAKAGFNLAGLVEISKKYQLMDLCLFWGAVAEGKVQVRNTKLSCLSADTYISLQFEAMQKSVLNSILDLKYSHSFLNKDNASIAKLHYENLVPVPECTYKEVKFAGGDGTEENPYQVATPEQLDAVRNNLSAHYIQIADIDMADWGNWEPIGNEEYPFMGMFDGNNHCISNLSIACNSDSFDTNSVSIGLFSYTNGAKISNVKICNGTYNANTDDFEETYFINVGGIAGIIKNTTIENCDFNGSINCTVGNYTFCRVAGISAAGISSTVTNCRINSNIYGYAKACNTMAAGVVAWLDSVTIDNCYVSGSIVGENSVSTCYVGGINASANSTYLWGVIMSYGGYVNNCTIELTNIQANGKTVYVNNIGNFSSQSNNTVIDVNQK